MTLEFYDLCDFVHSGPPPHLMPRFASSVKRAKSKVYPLRFGRPGDRTVGCGVMAFGSPMRSDRLAARPRVRQSAGGSVRLAGLNQSIHSRTPPSKKGDEKAAEHRLAQQSRQVEAHKPYATMMRVAVSRRAIRFSSLRCLGIPKANGNASRK